MVITRRESGYHTRIESGYHTKIEWISYEDKIGYHTGIREVIIQG